MLVIVAANIPNAVRGKLKLWFIEPKPFVFVSRVSDSVAHKVIDQLMELCDEESEILIIESIRKAPGYRLYQKLSADRFLNICGMQLIKAKASETDAKKVLPRRKKPSIWVGETNSDEDNEKEGEVH